MKAKHITAQLEELQDTFNWAVADFLRSVDGQFLDYLGLQDQPITPRQVAGKLLLEETIKVLASLPDGQTVRLTYNHSKRKLQF